MNARMLSTIVLCILSYCLLSSQAIAAWKSVVQPVPSSMAQPDIIRGISNLVIDSKDCPHFFMDTSSGAFHFYYDGSAWKSEQSQIGAVPVAIGPAGNFHAATSIGYPAEGGMEPTYTFFNRKSYRWTYLPGNGFSAESIALDTKSQPHFLYNTDSGLTYAVLSEGEWTTEVVHPGLGYGSMVLTKQGKAHITFSVPNYAESGKPMLYWGSNVQGKWHVKEIGTGGAYKIALDKQGGPHIISLAYNAPSQSIQYSRRDQQNNWVTLDVLKSLNLQGWGETPNILIDEEGHPNIFFIFHTDTDDYPVHAHFDGQYWVMDSLAQPGSGKAHMLLRTAKGKNRMHVLYFELDSQDPQNISLGTAIPLDWVWETAADLKFLSVKAITPSASTGQPGKFAVLRTGNLSTPVEVTYTLGGTAVNGLDYSQLDGTVTIPEGASSAIVDLLPVKSKTGKSAPKKTVTLKVCPTPNYLRAKPVKAAVVISGE